jgi:hypothetical protein
MNFAQVAKLYHRYLKNSMTTAPSHNKTTLAVKRARTTGLRKGQRGTTRPLETDLKASGYSPEAIKVYLQAYDEAYLRTGHTKKYKPFLAKQAKEKLAAATDEGKKAATDAQTRPSLVNLMKEKQYSLESAQMLYSTIYSRSSLRNTPG